MPRKRVFRRRRRRRRGGNRMIRYTGSGLTKSTPFPKVFLWKTKYVETLVSLNPGIGGTAASHLFSCNGLYDPNITGTGHQPIGFDQLVGTVYDHYRVIGSRIRVTAANNDSSNAQMLLCKVQDNTTISETDVSGLIENGGTRWTTLAPTGSGSNVKTLQMNWSAKKYFGKSSLGDNDYRGNVSANPDEQAYFRLMAQPVNASDTSDIRCTVEIDYIVLLTERKNLGQS